MKIEDLSRAGQLGLCHQAERLCGSRLRSVRRYADPRDKALERVLDERIDDWAAQRRALERLGRGEAGDEVSSFLRDAFPSLRSGIGEGPLNRDVALYLVECVEDERARFYHGMSAAARDEDARALFRQFADRDEAHLKFLRTASLSE